MENKLISVSILHRHGARGPGKSELSPWNDDHPVVSQWDPEDIENTTKIGQIMMLSLAQWFSSYLRKNNLFELNKSAIIWRSSRSSRAKESGCDFVHEINKIIKQEVSHSHLLHLY